MNIEDIDLNYSLTKEQTTPMYEWQKTHTKKYHKKLPYRGASPMSIYSVKFESCSIGSWATCTCSECLEAAESETDEKKKEKLIKQGTYEIFNDL
jgi:hypothetical protein